LSTCDAEHTSNQLGGTRAFVVGGNGVHNDARVDVGVDDSDGGNVLNGTFADGMKVRYGIEENGKVRDDAFLQGYLRSEEMDLVCESAGEPLFGDVIGLRAYALGSFEHGGAKVGTRANEDDGSVSRRDGAYESGCAAKKGEGALEVYDSDARACPVRIWDEVRVEEGLVMT